MAIEVVSGGADGGGAAGGARKGRSRLHLGGAADDEDDDDDDDDDDAAPAARAVCGLCGAEDPRTVCGVCRAERYCSLDCQRDHWRAHRKKCDAPPPPDGRPETPEPASGAPSPTSSLQSSTPSGVEATEGFLDDDDDGLGAALVAAGLGVDARTRRILAEAGVDGAALPLLTAADMADLGIRKGAQLRLRRAANDARCRSADPPEWLACPLSLELFVDPVLLVTDGQTYERADIAAWIAAHGSSPLTREPANEADLVPNRAIFAAADSFRAGTF